MQLIKFVLYLLALCAILKECCSSSFIYEVTGNVYPHSYYFVTLNVGDLPRPYNLVIDTGSFLTWIQCDPGVGFRKLYQGPHRAYDPRNGAGLVPCNNEICKYVQLPKIHHCNYASYLCDYRVTYAGGVSSKGVLVADSFTLQYINGTLIKPRLKFGCGYDQEYHGSHILHFDGILGLAKGPESILSQLQRDGATRNILAHCLSAQNGYLFFGDDMIPQGVVWTPMTEARTSQHYIFENVELYFGGLTTGIKGLNIMLDCGSAYSYLIHEAYKALVSMLENDIKGNQLESTNEEKFQLCWKGSTPFVSIEDVKELFKPIMLSFENAVDTQFQINPEGYLIITRNGNACFGIKDSATTRIPNINRLGSVSLVDKIIIYDNENHKIGWSAANCNEIPIPN